MIGSTGRNLMARTYRVSFFKRLADSTGHPVEAWQGSVEIVAPNRPCAIEAARRKFAEAGHVGTWSLRADYDEAELLPARTRLPSPNGPHRRHVERHAAA
jgi:hypothetical protein